MSKHNRSIQIIDEVMRKSYSQALDTTFKPNWKRVLAWVDKRVYQDVDMNDTESFGKAKITCEYILLFLNRWYKEILLPENVLAYSGLTLEGMVSGSMISSQIPIIKLQEKPIILSVSDVVCQDWQLYNDIEARIQAWLVSSSLECDDVVYHRLTMGPKGGFNQNMIELNKKDHLRTKDMVSQVVRALNQGADFPSVSRQCLECQFHRRCRI